MTFDHIGIPTAERKPGEQFAPAPRAWITDWLRELKRWAMRIERLDSVREWHYIDGAVSMDSVAPGGRVSYDGRMMKIAVLVGDGMGDYPIPAFGDRTVLQAAAMPNTRRIAAAGAVRIVGTVPHGMSPGSDVANLSLLGYNPAENYTGRAAIEAAGAGIELSPEDVAFRCNLVTVEDGRMADYSAGHISTEEARPLIEAMDAALGGNGCRFHPGVSYRHLLVWRDGPTEVRLQPPHDIADRRVEEYAPSGPRADEVAGLMAESEAVLRNHRVNSARRAAGLPPATQIWLWGLGRRMTLPTYRDLYDRAGGVVSAVDLVRGLGRLAGLDAPQIPGATGFLDTNYEGKVAAAVDLLRAGGFAYVHVEAPDECGHIGDAVRKKLACELFDERVVGPVWRALEADGEPYRLVVTTDHFTPCAVRGHTTEPVPFAWVDGPVGRAEREAPFHECVNDGEMDGWAFEVVRALLSEP